MSEHDCPSCDKGPALHVEPKSRPLFSKKYVDTLKAENKALQAKGDKLAEAGEAFLLISVVKPEQVIEAKKVTAEALTAWRRGRK